MQQLTQSNAFEKVIKMYDLYLFIYKVHYTFKIQIVQEIKNNKTITQKILIISSTI